MAPSPSDPSVRIQVRLFATYREIAGTGELTWTAEPGTTLGGFLEAFLRGHPRLVPHRRSMLLAVNLAFADPSTVLQEGDEVALLPPVSGGAP